MLHNVTTVMLLGVKKSSSDNISTAPSEFHATSEAYHWSPALFSDHGRENLDNLLHLLRPIFIASTYTCRCIHILHIPAFFVSRNRGM